MDLEILQYNLNVLYFQTHIVLVLNQISRKWGLDKSWRNKIILLSAKHYTYLPAKI